VRDIGDQFMFGPALLVAPITQPGSTRREVYLPQASAWYDFWTGGRIEGNTVESSAPLNRIPVYVRAGSIVPLGPVVQNAAAPTDMLEVRVYPGADASFEWYSDAGDTYDYEKGERRILPMHWEDATRTLTLGDAIGKYPGMPGRIRIVLVVVREGHGAGIEVTEDSSDGETLYDGKAARIKVR
jgi:alpha-D-xyloside xylohydrolase